MRLAKFQADGIAAQFNKEISIKDTAVLMVNHGILSGNEVFDPKINDTLTLNKNIKKALLENYPELSEENILGGWFGDMVINELVRPAPPAFTQMERTRKMRGENLGYNILHDTDGDFSEFSENAENPFMKLMENSQNFWKSRKILSWN